MTGLLSRLVAFVLVAAAVSAVLVALGVTWMGDLLDAVLPVDPTGADPFDLLAAAVALVALAAGIARQKRLAWVLGVGILAAGGLAQLLTFRHPIGAALAAVCLLGLLADRLRYRARTPMRWRRRLVALVVLGALLVAVESVLLDPSTANDPGGPASDLEELLGNVGAWLAFDPPLGIQPSDLSVPLEVLDLAARLAIVSATLAMLR
ncbi:MAG: hypothetical protein E6I94_08805, partial [Chloroflexi bacterium]